ncbi:MAG TPA: DinB family protein [Pseudonocardiaceae bacterium]|nr:DinB family protein [Pseudonocardiaceae bacterium]
MPGLVAPVADEREGLLAYLAQQRLVLRLTAHGLTDEQARAAPTASPLSVGGLIKHVTAAERGWIDIVLQRLRTWPKEYYKDHQANFRLGPDETLADVLDLYDQAAKETDAVIVEISDLGQPVPVPQDMPWFPDEVTAWSVRWVLLHLIEETARHAGHADIIRESLDGATALPLMAAAEGWPATPWVQPWEAPAQRT